MAASEKLLNGLSQIGIPDEKIEEFSKKLDKYINEIILFNSAYNLTNTSVYDEIVVNHILDSLAPYRIIRELSKNFDAKNFKIADIGSGGGLPGIPLAVIFPEFNFTLVERMDKRCAFLENCAAICGLKNVSVLKKEAEKVPPESFDISTFRAFRPLDEKMTKTLLSLTKKGGILAAYKAKTESIAKEMDEIKSLGLEFSVKKLFVPYLTENSGGKDERERNLVLIKKDE